MQQTFARTAKSRNGMLSKTSSTGKPFNRDQIVWFCYLMGAVNAYTAAALGPLMTFLRCELQIDYTVAAYHFSAWSLGGFITGFTGYRCMRLFGKQRTISLAFIGLTLGMITIICGRQPAVTIFGAFVCGICSGTLSQTFYTILADRFSELRTVAITEANVAASLLTSISPLAVGLFSRSFAGWRGAVVLPLLFFCFSSLAAGKILLPVSKEAEKAKVLSGEKLPAAYWLCWTLIFLSVASEWSLIFWSADFLEKTAGMVKADAAIGVSSFLAAMVTGRALGSRLAHRLSPLALLRTASLLALAGFLIFWLNRSVWPCVAGLFTAGLGISMFYPLTLSMAIGTAPALAAKATSRMSLSSGGATLLAPLLLGLIAARHGIFAGYGLVSVLLFCGAVLIFLPVWKKPEQPASIG
jgi:fucose permease